MRTLKTEHMENLIIKIEVNTKLGRVVLNDKIFNDKTATNDERHQVEKVKRMLNQ